MRSEVIEAVGSDGRVLRVDFVWRGDRYAHTVSMIDTDGAIVPLLKSIEGETDDNWPASPPLQTLSVENLIDKGRVALLVGMAGRSHWSASIESVHGEAKVVFDLACRHSEAPNRLGSYYLPASPLAPRRLSIESETASVLDASGVIEIAPIVSEPRGTTRWRFAIRLSSEMY